MTAATPHRRRRLALILALSALALLLAACSPEANRARGDGAGSGGDPGNRDASVQMLGGQARDARIYHDTPTEALPAGTGQP